MRNKSKKNHIISKIDSTRNKLHKAIDIGNDEEILRLSCKLDALIVEYLLTADDCIKNKDNSSLQPSFNIPDWKRKIIFKANEHKI